MASAVGGSLISAGKTRLQLFSGPVGMHSEQYFVTCTSAKFSLTPIHRKQLKISTNRRLLMVQAVYSNDGGANNLSIFVGGFVLGGLIVGTLVCLYAPQQIRKPLPPANKELIRKLRKFIYDEEKALEKTRKILEEKIAQLNTAIDEISFQIRDKDQPNLSEFISDGYDSCT